VNPEPKLSHVQIAQRSASGSVILFIGGFFQTLIAAVGIIIVARLLGPAGYGVYTLSLVLPGIIQIFLGLGVDVAVTRYAAYYVSIGKPDEAKRFSRNGFLFLILVGILLSVVNYLVAGVFSAQILHREDITYFVQVASFVTMGQAFFQAAVSALIGWNSMKVVGASQTLQAVLKASISIGLVLAGFGVLGAVVGFGASYVLAGGLATLALYVIRFRGRQKGDLRAFANDVKMMARYGLPLYVGSLLSGVASYYVFIIIASVASNAVVGLYAAANNLTTPFSLAATAIASALLPAFASLDGTGGDIAAGLRYAVKYVAYICTPIDTFFIPAAVLLLNLLYTSRYSSGAIYLQLLSIASLPVVLGGTVISTFFEGVGRTRLAMYATVLSAAVTFVLAPFFGLVLGLGVPGLIFATLLSFIIYAVTGLALAARYLKVSIDYRSASGIFAASLVAAAAALSITLIHVPEIVGLALQLVVFPVVYMVAVPFLKGIDQSDIIRLETLVAGLGPLALVARPLLRFERAVLKLVQAGPDT
jgi:O-antigen/teichoic acid export membrane protein